MGSASGAVPDGGADGSRGDEVYADTVVAVVDCKFWVRSPSRLWRRNRRGRPWRQAIDRADVENDAFTALGHSGDDLPRAQIHALEDDIEIEVPHRLVEIGDPVANGKTGVVDQNVDSARTGRQPGSMASFTWLRVGNVDFEAQGRSPVGSDETGGLERPLGNEIGGNDHRSFLRKELADRPADARSATGDERQPDPAISCLLRLSLERAFLQRFRVPPLRNAEHQYAGNQAPR